MEYPAIYKKLFRVIPARYLVTLLCFMAMFHMFALRICLSISLVDMTGPAISENGNNVTECPWPNRHQNRSQLSNTTVPSVGKKFNWDQSQQGYILSGYFYGFLVTQLLGGVLSTYLGAKWVSGAGIFISGCLSLAVPAAARAGIGALIAVRICTGLFSGLALAPGYLLMSRWTTQKERALFLALLYCGGSAGAILSQIGSGCLLKVFKNTDCAWSYPFYVWGGLACLWIVFWVIFVFDDPNQHPGISANELLLLNEDESQKMHGEKCPIPWLSILKSVPFWAVVATNFSHNWGLDLLQLQLPNYFSNVLHMDIATNGFYSSLPFFCKFLTGPLSGALSTCLQVKLKLRVPFLRKLFSFIAYFGAGGFILAMGFAGCSDWLNVLFVCAAMSLFGFYAAGINCVFVDMAPRFTGITIGISNTLANISGFICPITAGTILQSGVTFANWRILFSISGTFYIVSCALFLIFGSSELQPWAIPKVPKTATATKAKEDTCVPADSVCG